MVVPAARDPDLLCRSRLRTSILHVIVAEIGSYECLQQEKVGAARDTRPKTTNVLSLATRVDRRVWRLSLESSQTVHTPYQAIYISRHVSKSWFFPNFTSRRPQRRDQEYDALDQGYTPSSAGASSGAAPRPYSSQICRPEN